MSPENVPMIDSSDVNLDTLADALRTLADDIDDGAAPIKEAGATQHIAVGNAVHITLSLDYLLKKSDDGTLAYPVRLDSVKYAGGDS